LLSERTVTSPAANDGDLFAHCREAEKAALRRQDFQPRPDARYRTIPESSILELLLLVSQAYELAAGKRDAARAAASQALTSWVANGLGYREGAEGQRFFDPVEVINFLKWAGLTGQDRYWEDHFVKTHRAFVQEFRPGETEDSALNGSPRRFRVRLRRTFDLQALAEGTSARLRAPLPLTGAYLGNVQVDAVVPDAFMQDAVLREQCLEVRLKVPANPTITIGADLLFIATRPVGSSTPLSAQELELYRRKSEGFIRVTPCVEALAAELAGEGTSPREAVEAFWTYMMSTLCSGMVRYCDLPAESPVDWVLDNGWYDCQLGSALLVSLCRARGIPARIVSGHLLYRVQPISHFWSEVWLEDRGWCPFDVICWDLSRGGRDQAWRDVFAGQIDYRLLTQCFPLAFTGPMSVRFPQAWHMLQAVAGNGVDITYTDVKDGSLVYRDHAEVESLGPVPA
jgi:Transglutaminase-like superfamily